MAGKPPWRLPSAAQSACIATTSSPPETADSSQTLLPCSFASLFNPKDINLMACLEGGHPLLVVAAGGRQTLVVVPNQALPAACQALAAHCCRQQPQQVCGNKYAAVRDTATAQCRPTLALPPQACAALRLCGQHLVGPRFWRMRAAAVWCAWGLPGLPLHELVHLGCRSLTLRCPNSVFLCHGC